MLLILFIYCAVIVLSSLMGGALPQLVRLTHTRMQMTTSLVGGLMLGIALFHLLPHGVYELDSLDRGIWWMVMGLITTFFLLRMFHFHNHGIAEVDHVGYDLQTDCDHEHDHDHDLKAAISPGPVATEACEKHPHRLSWMGVFIGLSVHTLIDGLALGASVQASAAHGESTIGLYGLGTFLAIVLHKPLDAVSITSLMSSAGWSKSSQQKVNLAYAMICPLGAFLFVLGINQLGDQSQVVIGCALAFSAGVFLSIALSDLLPELEFHAHDRATLSAALIVGLALAYGLIYLEPTHQRNQNLPLNQIEAPAETTP
ncbi:zinc transporter ZupT [Polystyrenella longa]|uniref:Zinc transporter ZupT n=1 Tax=Polystyrenella longa TaxID=2528007 RepID=A0A518CRR8_9PLAN|nr:ZIP family metal transporter [Polystyrenella longa]QDU81922.1 zinc transporter ZupT [Polystyrenella longa]